MAALLPDGITVGPYPLPATALKLADLASVGDFLINAIPAGFYEFKPVVPDGANFLKTLIKALFPNNLTEQEPKYISPYDSWILPVTAVPTFLNEKILGMDIDGPFACMLESPGPILEFPNAVRSLDRTVRIGLSPYWSPQLFFEPFVGDIDALAQPRLEFANYAGATTAPGVYSGGIGSVQPDGYPSYTVTLGGYYTERNWTDRYYITQEYDCFAKYDINGRFTKPFNRGKPLDRSELPLDPSSIKDFQASRVTPFTFFATNPITQKCVEDVMPSYLRCAEKLLTYKHTEIRSMRFYFRGIIDSIVYLPYSPPGPPPPAVFLRTPFIAHMSVDTNHDLTSVARILCAAKMCNGPCRSEAVYNEDLGAVPRTAGPDTLETACYTTLSDYERANSELQTEFDEYITSNVQGDTSGLEEIEE